MTCSAVGLRSGQPRGGLSVPSGSST
jgi:hypothetical protein